MKIRQATLEDTPKIIELLKVSLGESLIPKTEHLWLWKHWQNPFGPSPTLLAFEGEQLVGVRAFLRWEFVQAQKIFKACRAVDTATHPDFQGKSIFTKLSSTLIEEVHASGVDFIYNTPNAQSTPGYLKMGWKKWGKLPLKLQFHINKGKNRHALDPDPWKNIASLVHQLENPSNQKNGTHLIPKYLHWRYEACPLFPYYFISDGASYLLFYRIKEGKLGRELRICDFFHLEAFQAKQKAQLNQELKKVQRIIRPRFTSLSGVLYEKNGPLELGNLPVFKAGPLVTLRETRSDFDPQSQDWSWSLGDLELF